MQIIKNLFILVTAALIAGCASKMDTFDEFNHTDAQWLEIISQHIRKNELDKADQAYISLYSEHITSQLLRPASLMLARAHALNSEYKLANYYIDEFNKLFANAKNIEWSEYLKVRNDYYALALPTRNQALLLATRAKAQAFLQAYPRSLYAPLVASIKTRLELARYLTDKKILHLYTRMGRTESAEAIRRQMQSNDLADVEYIEPELVWYRKIFE